MSRIGRKPIAVPAGVKIQISKDSVEVQGPKGKLSVNLPRGIHLEQKGAELHALRQSDDQAALHGLARALVAEPKILLADEPTGDLDGKTAEAVFGLIQRLHEAHGLTSVLVTHNLEFAQRCGRVLRLRDGQLVDAKA